MKRKGLKWLVVLIFAVQLLSACGVEPIGTKDSEESVFDEVLNRDETSEVADETVDEDIEEEVLMTYEMLNYSEQAEVIQTTEAYEIDGYFEGRYYAEQLTPVRSTIVFIERSSGEHLDLLEVSHENGEWLSAVKLSEEFREIHYTLNSMYSETDFIYEVATGRHEKASDFEPTVWEIASEVLEMDYDVVIENGIVIDPVNEAYMFGFDVGIKDGKIQAIVDASELKGKEVIDATGLMVSPGFIDMLTFNLSDIGAKYKILDGVTSGLSNHGCSSDFDAFFDQYGRYGSYVNYGGAVFAIKLRWEVGLANSESPNQTQIDQMAQRVREEIEKGAIALAFSPEYYPGTSPEEIKAMMAVAKEYDIPTHFHARHSSIVGENTGIVGVEEVIGYARELDADVQFMHLHSTGGTGMMDEALALIEAARQEGYQVDYDIYPYDSWASRINMARFRDGWQERYGITYSDLQMAGTSQRLTKKTFEEYQDGNGLVVAYAMDENEMLTALEKDYAMVGSDGCIEHETGGNDHFRGAGSFSRILGKYVRDENVFSLMDGIQKMTINNAAHFEDISEAMALRGRMEVGCVADITVFDYRTILDQSNAEFPATPSIGIEYVLVNGKVGVREGELDRSVRAGQPIDSDYRNN